MLHDIAKAIKKELDTCEKKPDLEYTVFTYKDTNDIYRLYKSYAGCTEFLYIPPREEIHAHLTSDTACYFGAKNGAGQAVSVSKIEKLKIPSPFFVPPKYEDHVAGQFFGLSGMLVAESCRRQGISKTTTTKALKALSDMGASGVYADCDFRNIASFSTLSSVFNFVGFADGRHGAEGEKTIYTTFYLSFGNHEKKEIPQTILDLSYRESIDNVPCLLQTQMSHMGTFSSYEVRYGNGYNELHVLDDRVQTPHITLILEKAKPIMLKKHIVIPTKVNSERGQNERC